MEEFLENFQNKEDIRELVLSLWQLKRVGEAGEMNSNWQLSIAAWVVHSLAFSSLPFTDLLSERISTARFAWLRGSRHSKGIQDCT